MTIEDQNRMAHQQKRGRGRPPRHQPQESEVVAVSVEVTKCPWCGAARLSQWVDLGTSGSIERSRQKRCKVCQHVYVFLANGMLRLVR